jgi:Spy/CpxP family protein refolding chaperone
MKRQTMRIGLVLAVVGAIAGSAAAQPYGPGYGGGPGMMRGYEGGPGMMRGYEGGPGMMRGYEGGPGVMRGYGPGPMGGNGPGAGTMGRGYGAAGVGDLTDDQRDKIAKIQEDARRKNWDTMGQLRSEQFRLRGLYSADKLDSEAIADQQRKVDELRRTMIKSRVETHNQVNSILTPEQRKQLRGQGPWWLQEDE